MKSAIFLVVGLCLSLPAFAAAKSKVIDAKAAEENKKKVQLEELKQNMAKYIEEDNFRRQLESAGGGRTNNYETSPPPKAAETFDGQVEAKRSSSNAKAANCGTYEESESCRVEAQVSDDEKNLENSSESADDGPADADFED